MNDQYKNISIPNNIDDVIDSGINKALKEIKTMKKKHFKRNIGIAAAIIATVLTIGITNPAMASKLPILGSAFQAIEKNIFFPGDYSEYSTAVNETAYSNDVGVTLSDILCDGQSLYVTYIIESEKPFKYTSWGDAPLTMNQLLTQEKYNKVNFSNKELDNTGFAGLEGKFTDDNTFVGVEKYKLASLNTEIPDEFTFQVKFTSFETHSLTSDRTRDTKSGTWAFKVPVKVNKDLRKIVSLTDVENDTLKINSLSITPYDMIISTTFKKDTWSNYDYTIYDETGNKLTPSDSSISEDNKTENYIFQAPPKDSKNIRIVITKPILEKGKTTTDSKGQSDTQYKQIGEDLILDKIISIS
jgi:hypothetical protein